MVMILLVERRKVWEKWVDERANQMVLGKWTRKTMKSVLATGKKKVQAGVSPQQGKRGERGDEDDEEVVKKVRYDFDVEFDQPYYDGDEDAGDEDGEVGAMDEEDGGTRRGKIMVMMRMMRVVGAVTKTIMKK